MFSLEYLAGFFDGEGCITTRGYERTEREKRPTIRPAVVVTNTNLAVLSEFKRRWNGQIYTRKALPNHQTCYSWDLGRFALTEKFLLDLLPFLVVKRAQAELMLQLCARRQIGRQRLSGEEIQFREGLRLQIQSLNGWNWAKHRGMFSTPPKGL